jgi:molybdate transport system substrate-binding protein
MASRRKSTDHFAPGPNPVRRSVVISLLLVLATGCGGSTPANAPLRVAIASDLQTVFPVLAARFQADTGIKVEASVGSSGKLAKDIAGGAPFDVFLSANRKFVDDLAATKAIDPASVRPYARGALVVAVFEKPGLHIQSLDDLTNPEIKKIAIANPDLAPYGLAAKQALQKVDLWDKLQPKIVRAETVAQAYHFVESGNAEVGLVSHSSVGSKSVKAFRVDKSLYEPIVQTLGVVSASKRQGDARAFADFMTSDVGMGILADFGFARPDSDTRPSEKDIRQRHPDDSK